MSCFGRDFTTYLTNGHNERQGPEQFHYTKLQGAIFPSSIDSSLTLTLISNLLGD